MFRLQRLVATGLALALLGAADKPSTVRIALREQPNTLDPLVATQYDENYISEGIFSGLTLIDDRGVAQPDLAEAVPTRANGGVSADGKTLTYRLRPNARWQDGAPVTADDVVFTFAKMRDPKVPFPTAAAYDVIQSVEARGPHAVVVRLKHPAPDAPYELFVNGQNGAIVPKHVLEHVTDLAQSSFSSAPVGSGPYRVERWERGSHVTLVANPLYFHGAPKVDRLVISFVPDSNARAFEMQSHDIDLTRIEAFNAPAVRATTGVRVESIVTPTLVYLQYRTDTPPFDDVRVRRALASMVDRKQIAAKVWLGQAVAAADLLPPASPFHARLRVTPIGVVAASALLEAAGWHAGSDGIRRRNGQPLDVVLTTAAGSPAILRAAVLLQSAWKAIGVTSAVRPLQTNLLFSPTGVLARGDFSVALTAFSYPVTPDRSMMLASSAKPPSGYNYSRTQDGVLDRLMDEARYATDVGTRRRLFRAIAARVADRVPLYPLVWTKALFGVSTRVDGIRPEPVNSDLWNVWLWRVRK